MKHLQKTQLKLQNKLHDGLLQKKKQQSKQIFLLMLVQYSEAH
jgi:hypothetical protein